MPTLHVSPLSRLDQTVAEVGASHLVTLINIDTKVVRPPTILPERHLFLGMSDIVEPLEGHVTPAEAHVRSLMDFVAEWDRTAPLLFHCWAGISRSTAAAFISVCMLNPERSEEEIATTLRIASPSATPNARLVAIADAILLREGRMSQAVAKIGRGADAFEGSPFGLSLR